ncbi:hypothetical protein ACIQUF_07145 [Pseudomonas sp. NPDC090233]|uniref:hypothetical protein n=1 Tax=Pseudomonas sp. NPDC090233 TaxID=3364479 RepID=UPI003839DF3B
MTPDGLSFKQHGEVPFSSIKAYTLEGGIRLTRHDNPPLTLIGNKKTPGYEDFRKAFRAAMAAWSEDATSDQVKQQHFFGTALAKVMGALIVIICGGLIIATMILKMGMSALPALAIATFTGVRLLFSRRQE